MRINNNLMAMNTHRQLSINNSNSSKSVEKLSSGFRINRAGDDAAGLAISEKMRAQIRGLNMASKNSQDAISLVQTAEGALTETHSILQRMRELAVQSSTDTNDGNAGTTNGGVDRTALQSEFAQLKTELTDISSKTAFNNKTLLDGSIGIKSDASAVEGVKASTDYTITEAANLAALKEAFANMSFSAQVAADTYDVTFTNGEAVADVITLAGQASTGAKTYTITSTKAGPLITNNDFEAKTYDIKDGEDVVGTITLSSDAISAIGTAASQGLGDVAISGDMTVFQTGANKGDTLSINIGDMSAVGLGLTDIDISTREGASAAIETVNTAINDVSTQRAGLGAVQNRLEHKIANLDASAENLQAAESRIRDVDMAKEMMEYTKNNILSQAANAMLAQANQAPQNVLQLLR